MWPSPLETFIGQIMRNELVQSHTGCNNLQWLQASRSKEVKAMRNHENPVDALVKIIKHSAKNNRVNQLGSLTVLFTVPLAILGLFYIFTSWFGYSSTDIFWLLSFVLVFVVIVNHILFGKVGIMVNIFVTRGEHGDDDDDGGDDGDDGDDHSGDGNGNGNFVECRPYNGNNRIASYCNRGLAGRVNDFN
jgi:hypothetical protein